MWWWWERRWRWHAYGQQLEVSAVPSHEDGDAAMVPAVPLAERGPRRGNQAVDGQRQVPGAVELQQAAAQVAALQHADQR